jgi:TolB-like protein/Tfp pilus assembly protein PilF
VTESSRAVFLSYASQDAQAAERICDALRASGIEVWLDQSELRGGDAWDHKIRQQIHDCTLFIPIVSVHTQERTEGYFRLEWHLADQRTHLMGRRAFLVPVCVDSTPESEADVPDSFSAVHWTRLPGGATPPAFVEHIQRLLVREPHGIAPQQSAAGAPAALRWEKNGPSAASFRRKHAAPLLILAGVIGAGCYLAIDFVRHRSAGPPEASIAVLPLTNETGDPEQLYFSDGLSENLITALSQFTGLKVIGRSSSFQFRDAKEDSRAIGLKLGVAKLLEGSVQHAGGAVRISAELIDAADGRTLWSERYDRPYKDLFALQDEITQAVIAALRVRLLPGAQAAAQTERPPSGNLEAYNAWLQGNFYRERGTEADTRRAIELYTRATQVEPRYAVAWSSLAAALADLEHDVTDEPMRQADARARIAADTALTLAPQLAPPHVVQARLLRSADFDWSGAEAEFRRALQLAPNDGEARFELGFTLAAQGRVESAIELTRQALATDPLRARWVAYVGIYSIGLNRLDDAEGAFRHAIELLPNFPAANAMLAVIFVKRGAAQAALATAQQVPAGWWHDYAVALATQIGSDRTAADAALKTFIDQDTQVASYQIAQVYALRHDTDKTFEWLDRAFSHSDIGIAYLLYDPFILRYRDDLRFAAFCRKVHLPVPAAATAARSP